MAYSPSMTKSRSLGVTSPLAVDTVLLFLLDHDLLSRGELFAHSVTAAAVSRRNRNLRVTISATRGFFIKQVEPVTESGVESLRREIAFYSDARTRAVRARGHAPTPVWCDQSRPLLVLELLPGHEGLWNHYSTFAAPRFPVACYKRLGQILAELHGVPADSSIRPVRDAHDGVPWVMAAHQPPVEALVNLSPAGSEVLRIVQASEVIAAGLTRAANAWKTAVFIHGDLRADNVLVRVEPDESADVRLVDWELARPGDPMWDVAALVQDLLLYWVSGLDAVGPDADIARIVGTARVPWTVLQPAVQALWRAYTTTTSSSQDPERLATLTAVRALQSVLEMAERRVHLPANGVLLLQMVENLLLDPGRAAAELLGIH
jgi:aminoglycoside phosphotransferase (APT) family kinase protein